MTTPGFSGVPQAPQHAPLFDVKLPVGGTLHLHSVEEVEVWEATSKAYQKDYNLVRVNDLTLLGAILTQTLALFRAQQRLNGIEPEFDGAGVATGRYKKVGVKAADLSAGHDVIRKASQEIRELEKSLGIDKRTREAGGQETTRDYINGLKRFAHQFGVHISKRVIAYENFCMELRVKLRMLANLDQEDLAYENISPEKVLDWARDELAKLEEADRRFANEKGKLFVGRV